MGTTPHFNAYYGKNDKGQKVKLGIAFNNKKFPGINHPSELLIETKPTLVSKKPTTKKQETKKRSRK